MFKLNGDTIKQLNNLYGISFKHSYKEELKNRIIAFASEKINEYRSPCLIETFSNCSEIIIFKENKPYLLTTTFFDKYKDELFISFNPLWYNQKEIKKSFSKYELDCMFNSFLNKLCYEAQKPFLDAIPLLFNKEELPFHFCIKHFLLKRRECSVSFDLNLLKKSHKKDLEDLYYSLKTRLENLDPYFKTKKGIYVEYKNLTVYFDFGFHDAEEKHFFVSTAEDKNEVKSVIDYHFSKRALILIEKGIKCLD